MQQAVRQIANGRCQLKNKWKGVHNDSAGLKPRVNSSKKCLITAPEVLHRPGGALIMGIKMQHKRLFVCLALAVGIVCVSSRALVGCDAQASPRITDEQAVTAYISDFLKIYPKQREKMLVAVPVIIKVSKYERLDPLFVATLFAAESSMRMSAVGERGELGLMQLMPNGIAVNWARRNGHDISTIEGNMMAGAWLLGQCIDKCDGNLGQAIGCYMASGSCNAGVPGARYKMRLYRRNVERYRGSK